jgi:hypothetical protein
MAGAAASRLGPRPKAGSHVLDGLHRLVFFTVL